MGAVPENNRRNSETIAFTPKQLQTGVRSFFPAMPPLPQVPSQLSRARIAAIRFLGLLLPLSLLVTGCVLMPTLGRKKWETDLQRTAAMAPPQWSASSAEIRPASEPWLQDFSHPRLVSLVAEAMAHNHDLRAAAARIKQAKAEHQRATAPLLPTLGTGFSANRNQQPTDQRFSGLQPINNRFRLPLDFSWEIDLWGRLADNRRAAQSRWHAQQDDYEAARLSLQAAVVKATITLCEARHQRSLAVTNIQTREVQLKVLERVMEQGLAAERSALDVSLARADLDRAKATLDQRNASVDQATRALEVLLGRHPAAKETGLEQLPKLRRAHPAALPVALLSRRPDLRAAQRRLESALALESSAKKSFLPNFTIPGSVGRTAQQTGNILTPQAVYWSIGANVSQQLFQGGATLATLRISKARYDEQLEIYAQAVLTAFNEVETALAADGFLAQQANSLQQSAQEAERAETLAQSQYQRGLIEALTLLDSQQRAFDSRSAWIAVEATRLRTRVDLHLAMGGALTNQP